MAKIYGIKNIGKHILEIYDNLPAWSPDDEGRLIYVKNEKKLYYSTDTNWNSNIGGSGFSGYSGIDGTSGGSGYSGYSGYSGDGISGYSGYSGESVDWQSDNNVSNLKKGYFTIPGGLIINYGYYDDTSSMTSWSNTYEWLTPGQKRYHITYMKPFPNGVIYSSVFMVRNTKNPNTTHLEFVPQILSIDNFKTTLDIYLNEIGGLSNIDSPVYSTTSIRNYAGFLWLSIGY